MNGLVAELHLDPLWKSARRFLSIRAGVQNVRRLLADVGGVAAVRLGSAMRYRAAATSLAVHPFSPLDDLRSRLRNMPSTIETAVTGYIAGLFVIFPRIERMTFIGPLFAAVVAGDDSVIVHRLG